MGGVVDLLGVDELLGDTERQVRDVTSRLVAERFAPHMAQWWDDGVLPREVMTELGAAGLFGMQIDGYGCAGLGAVAYGVACRELEACDSGLRSAVSVQGSLTMHAIVTFGSDEQRDRWLPGLASGKLIGCFALTEPDAGSDPSAMRCRARRDGGDWLLSGTKMWITNGSSADVAVVWAADDDGRIRGFLVERGMDGFSARDIHRKTSLRASVTSELVFDSVRVPASAELPGVSGLGSALACLNEARFGIVWGVVGAARACLDVAAGYAATREVFGRPLAGLQLTQAKLSEMAVTVGRSGLLAMHLGRRKEAGVLTPAQVSAGKLHNVAAALDTARTARSVLGANGVTLEYPVSRHMNNLEAVYTYEGTHEVHTLIVGEAVTGVRAFA